MGVWFTIQPIMMEARTLKLIASWDSNKLVSVYTSIQKDILRQNFINNNKKLIADDRIYATEWYCMQITQLY